MYGEIDAYVGVFVLSAFNSQQAAMIFHYTVADAEAEAGALPAFLGGKKRITNLLHEFLRDTYAVIKK